MRIHWIDFLRLIAAISIIAIHVSSPYFSKLAPPDNSWWLANIIMSISKSMGPALFVMISGSVLMRREFEYATFYRTRAKRLIIPLIFWSLFYALFSLIFIEHSFRDFVWRISAGFFLSGKTYFHLWYLSMFFCLMLIAPIINKWIFGVRPSSNDLFIITILAAVFFGLSSLSHLKEALSGGDITWFKNFGIYVIYFILGHLITIHIDSVRISSKNLVLIYLATIIIGVALNYILALHSLGNDNTIISDDTIIGFIATCSIFSLAAKLQPGEKHQKILHEGALNSFGIYLIHPLLLFFCFKFMSLSMSNENVIMISTIFITTCLSYILIATIRKTNFGRLIT